MDRSRARNFLAAQSGGRWVDCGWKRFRKFLEWSFLGVGMLNFF